MTIEIHKPELEELIRERLQESAFTSVEDLLLDALRSTPAKTDEPGPKQPRKTLSEFFRDSPLMGLELDLKRSKETSRDIEL